jgi:hypothetical protein
LYAQASQALPAAEAPEHRRKLTYATLAELERTGALTIHQRDTTPREGDVVLRTLGRPPAVVAEGDEKLDGIAHIVEVDATRLDAHFVTGFLRAELSALPVANTLGAVSRDDLRRCRIPRMPLAEQHRYGDAFRRLMELDVMLKRLAKVSGKVIEQMSHGLTSGAIAPDHEGETR